MSLSVSELKSDIEILGQLLREKKVNLFRMGPKRYSHKVESFKAKFGQYHVATTLKKRLSKLYYLTGRYKFYADNMLYIYLEVEEKKYSDGTKLSTALAWPFLCKWKVEMIDENEEKDALLLGEASCFLNRPRRGLKSYPNDWISIDLATIENSGLITEDGSVALRWTVLTEAFIHDVHVEDFQKLLDSLERFCDSYEEPETVIRRIKQRADTLLEKRRENKKKVAHLENEAFQLSQDLRTIETELDDFRRSFTDIMNHLKPLLIKLGFSPRRVTV